MRSTLISAAFAAGALAVPAYQPGGYGDQPAGYGAPPAEVETAVHVVYMTEVVTVTAGPAPAYTPESKPKHYGHKSKKPITTTEQAAPPAYTPPPTYEAPANTPPTYEAPANTPPTYEAPPSEEPAPAPSSAPSGPESGSYADVCLQHHNMHRAKHSAPALVWSDSLAATAKKIADTCVYAHNTEMDGGGYGQNIAAGVKGDNISAVITDLFYNAEEPAYSVASKGYTTNPDMTNFEVWGHFSQIVWCATTEVGCATSENCGSLANTGSGVEPYFTVCNYKGPGNYAGQYVQNVYPGDAS